MKTSARLKDRSASRDIFRCFGADCHTSELIGTMHCGTILPSLLCLQALLIQSTFSWTGPTRITGKTSLRLARPSQQDTIVGTISFLVPSDDGPHASKFGSSSPVGSPPLLDAVEHLANKATWFADGRVQTFIASRASADFSTLCQSNIVLAIGLKTAEDLAYIHRVFETRKSADNRRQLCHFAVDCAEQIPAIVGIFDESKPSLMSRFIPWSEAATARREWLQMSNLFERWTSDDFCYAMMVFVNQFVHEVDWVKHRTDATWEKGIVRNAKEFFQMFTKCGPCIGRCVKDPLCRECLAKLTQVDTRDQVQSYKTIVSYESDLLRDVSLCLLTKNNIFGCDATIPTIPKVPVLAKWRGEALTEPVARGLLVGHLKDDAALTGSLKLLVSWKVACGANAAYDQFPSQNQIFYPATRGRDMWYDPVFRVKTLDGRHVWCKRHYKVRPQTTPGTFRFSVLDNGVTSDEFWTIVGVADDLSWIVFHYAGAAKAVGQRYLGGLLCTPDGYLPPERKLPEIWDCFRRASIQPWDLYIVDNDSEAPGALAAGPPPLDFYRDEVRAKRPAASV